jgi:hypothetical protein
MTDHFLLQCKACGAPLKALHILMPIRCDHCGLVQAFSSEPMISEIFEMNGQILGGSYDLIDGKRRLLDSFEHAWDNVKLVLTRQEGIGILKYFPDEVDVIAIVVVCDFELNWKGRGISFYTEFVSKLYSHSDNFSKRQMAPYIIIFVFALLSRPKRGPEYITQFMPQFIKLIESFDLEFKSALLEKISMNSLQLGPVGHIYDYYGKRSVTGPGVSENQLYWTKYEAIQPGEWLYFSKIESIFNGNGLSFPKRFEDDLMEDGQNTGDYGVAIFMVILGLIVFVSVIMFLHR